MQWIYVMYSTKKNICDVFIEMHEQWTKKYYGNHCTVQYCTVQVCFEIKHVMEDEEVAWVLEVVGCKRSHLGDMSEDEFRYIYSNEYHVVLVGDSRDPFAFFFEVC